VYDTQGRLIQDEHFTPGGRLQSATQPAAGTNTMYFYTDSFEDYRYDLYNKNGVLVCNIYSRSAQVESLHYSNNLLIRHEWPQQQIHAVYGYDSEGRMQSARTFQQQRLLESIRYSYLTGLHTNEISYYSRPDYFDQKIVFQYDNALRLLSRSAYTRANTVLHRLIIKYEDALPLEELYYSGASTLTNLIQYGYGGNPPKLRTKSISNAAFIDVWTYEDGGIHRSRVVSAQASAPRREFYRYTQDERLLLARTIDAEGAPLWQTNYSYNSFHDISAISITNTGTLVSDTVYHYTYDHHGNWTNKVEYDRRFEYGRARLSPIRGEMREILYHDAEHIP
jgi:hypothetical protein